MLGLSAAAAAIHVMRASSAADRKATGNLTSVLHAARAVFQQTGQFTGAQPDALNGHLGGISVLDSVTPSVSPLEVSEAVTGDSWFGAVRSTTGRCFAVSSLRTFDGAQALLPGNCTGAAAMATLMVLPPPPDSMSAAPQASDQTGTSAPQQAPTSAAPRA
jgi:hypothetical protein